MKTPKLLIYAALACMAASSSAAWADRPYRLHPGLRDPAINQRQPNREQPVEGGAQSGELTRREARQLDSGERASRREERQSRSGRRMSQEERRELHQDMNRLSKEIYEERRDGEKRRWAR